MLVQHPAAIIFYRAKGDDLRRDGILSGFDILAVDANVTLAIERLVVA